jgi:hypothetical protein
MTQGRGSRQGNGGEIARDLEDAFETSIQTLINVTEKSGNLRKDLRDDIMKSVSTLRGVYNAMKANLEEKIRKLDSFEFRMNNTNVVVPEMTTQMGKKKTYSEVLSGNTQGNAEQKTFKLTVRSKSSHSIDHIKNLVKSKVNPVDMKIGITTFKGLRNGRLLIETQNKTELDALSNKINEVCGEELEASTPRRRNPRLIIYNVPDEINMENAQELIMKQNGEQSITQEDIIPRFIFKDKRTAKNLVIEVNSTTRKKLLGRKMKLGWNMCNVDDYIRINRCYKCSKFNHMAQDCKGELTCPNCAGMHSLRECQATKEEYKCANCVNYNKYNHKSPVNDKHSSLDNSCSCYQNMMRRFIETVDY